MMTAEQEIEILKGQVAQLYGMIMTAKEAEIPVPVCGPVIPQDVLTSGAPIADPDDKTIKLNGTENDPINGKLQIVGADTVVASSASFPMMSGPNVGETPKSIEWVQVDGANAAPDASSLAIRGEAGAKKLEIKGFLAHVDESPGEGSGWAVLMNNCSPGKPDMKYVGVANFKAWLALKDEKVKVSEGDTASGYLAGLITAGTANIHLLATNGNLAISVDEVSGPSGTVAIGATTTGSPGTSASVVNVGTPAAAILNFTIPSGVSGTDGITSVAMKWDGLDARPSLKAGGFWYLSNVTLVNHVQTFFMAQMCLPMYDVPGTSLLSSNISIVGANGDSSTVTVVDGLVVGHVGETLTGTNPTTGEPISLTVAAGGTLAGYTGEIRMVDPGTGISVLYRINSEGKIER